LLIVVVQVQVQVVVIQVTVPGVVGIVLICRPEVGVVAQIVEVAIVVAITARKTGNESSRWIDHAPVFRAHELIPRF
jgi:hypothetical protein